MTRPAILALFLLASFLPSVQAAEVTWQNPPSAEKPDTDKQADQGKGDQSTTENLKPRRALKALPQAVPMELKFNAAEIEPARQTQQGPGRPAIDNNRTEAGDDVQIREDDRGIVVEVMRHYGPNDMDKLKQNHPDLADYVEMFPKQSGVHQIALNLDIQSVYRAANVQELQRKYPEAYHLYMLRRQQLPQRPNRN